jgi:hypothetical protein
MTSLSSGGVKDLMTIVQWLPCKKHDDGGNGVKNCPIT